MDRLRIYCLSSGMPKFTAPAESRWQLGNFADLYSTCSCLHAYDHFRKIPRRESLAARVRIKLITAYIKYDLANVFGSGKQNRRSLFFAEIGALEVGRCAVHERRHRKTHQRCQPGDQVLGRGSPPVPPQQNSAGFSLTAESQANVSRHDRLRGREGTD